jgi:protein subunit release factor B
MPAQLRLTVRRALVAAASGLLLILALPAAAMAAETSRAIGGRSVGFVAAAVIAFMLVAATALSVHGQVQRERKRMQSTARHLARHRLVEDARRRRMAHRSTLRRSRTAFRRTAAR